MGPRFLNEISDTRASETMTSEDAGRRRARRRAGQPLSCPRAWSPRPPPPTRSSGPRSRCHLRPRPRTGPGSDSTLDPLAAWAAGVRVWRAVTRKICASTFGRSRPTWDGICTFTARESRPPSHRRLGARVARRRTWMQKQIGGSNSSSSGCGGCRSIAGVRCVAAGGRTEAPRGRFA